MRKRGGKGLGKDYTLTRAKAGMREKVLVCKYIIRASGHLLGMDKFSGTEVKASIELVSIY